MEHLQIIVASLGELGIFIGGSPVVPGSISPESSGEDSGGEWSPKGPIDFPKRTMSNFTVNPTDAGRMVHGQRKSEDERHCYLIQVTFQTVYSDAEIPNSVIKKLPRLINGIPLGAGLMARDQLGSIRWRYIEGGRKMHTFISRPICQEEAEESKRSFKDRLVKQSPAIFGDITVKATVILSQCLNFDDEFIVNDIAIPLDEGLHFRD